MLKSSTLAVCLLAALAPAWVAAFQEKKSPAAPPLEFEGSLIVALEVRDLQASRAWYEKVLGAKLFYELEGGGWCELTTPVEKALVGLKQVDPGKAPIHNGGSVLSFGVKDMAKAKAWLEGNKVKLKGEVIEIPQTVKLLYFEDHDGNTLLFYQPWQKL